MFRLLFSLILLHSLSICMAMAQNVSDNNNQNAYDIHSEERACAHQWLLDHGLNSESVSLILTYEDEGFLVFEDSRNHCFCIVANKDVWPLLYGPVLAYSTETPLYLNPNTASSQQYNCLVKAFRDQLAALKKNSASPDTTKALYIPKNKEVQPMTAEIKWNQGNPYNMFAPTKNGNRVLIGCVPTATAIVMGYHQWPERGEDHCYYLLDNKTIATMDFSKCTPQWKLYKSKYFPKDTLDEGAMNLSKLMVSIGLSVDASFSDNGTNAYLKNVKPTLCNHFGYSAHIAHYDIRQKIHTLTEDQLEALLYKELDEGRPCIVTNNGHAFVCDGYNGDFLHYNLGWSGHYNGYYRLRLGPYKKSDGELLTLIKGIVYGIEPQRNESAVIREITLKKAGTLEEMLTDSEKETITKLTLKGPLNSSDIKLLRKMAGANDEFSLDGWRGGALRELNLREAKIKSDKSVYYTKPATGIWTSYENNKPRKYDFSKITKSEWVSFKNSIGSRLEGMQIIRTDDDRYLENYFCQGDIIGKCMFANCSSLKSLVLPITIEKVDNYAFAECTSLTSIILPPSTESIGKDPFRGCCSLEEVIIPRRVAVKDGTICEGCSPILRSVKRY